jgi:hypothetical protein
MGRAWAAGVACIRERRLLGWDDPFPPGFPCNGSVGATFQLGAIFGVGRSGGIPKTEDRGVALTKLAISPVPR